MNCNFTEYLVEHAAPAWPESVGWQIRNGTDIAHGELRARETERAIKVAIV